MGKIYLSWEDTDMTVTFVDILVIVIDNYDVKDIFIIGGYKSDYTLC